MIDINELKRGNLLSNYGKYVKVLGIFNEISRVDDKTRNVAETVDFIQLTDLLDYTPQQLQPIELTEDLLLKLGFELKNQWFDYELDGFRLGYITDDTHFQFETSSNKVIDVKSLHDLQNLYFFNNLKELDTSKII